MHCNYKNDEGIVNGIMCGKSGNYCATDQWCTGPSEEKQSYWTNKPYNGYPNCYSKGKKYQTI